MENNKKQGKGLVVIVVILIIAVLGLVGFICYDKHLIFSSTSKDNDLKSNNTSSNSKEKLDINSRLVQDLYSLVTIDADDCNKNWIYGYDKDNNKYNDEFNVETADESVKMNFVGNLLSESKINYVDCSTITIPNQLNDADSFCYASNNEENKEIKTYDKSYIEYLYKKLFGKNQKLDTNVEVKADKFGGQAYFYISSYDKYFLYLREVGGTCGPDKYNTKITKAFKIGKQIKIYENEILNHYEEGNDQTYGTSDDVVKEVSNNTYIYTFNQEDDGMYSFVSRLKEK